jgi:hypothetical protein
VDDEILLGPQIESCFWTEIIAGIVYACETVGTKLRTAAGNKYCESREPTALANMGPFLNVPILEFGSETGAGWRWR